MGACIVRTHPFTDSYVPAYLYLPKFFGDYFHKCLFIVQQLPCAYCVEFVFVSRHVLSRYHIWCLIECLDILRSLICIWLATLAH